jgi:hypothetical protein
MRRAILRALASPVRRANGSGRACYNEVASVNAPPVSLAHAGTDVDGTLEACDQAFAPVKQRAVPR